MAVKHRFRWSELGSPTEPGFYSFGEFDVTVRQTDLDRLARHIPRDPVVEFVEATRLQSRRRELVIGLVQPD